MLSYTFSLKNLKNKENKNIEPVMLFRMGHLDRMDRAAATVKHGL